VTINSKQNREINESSGALVI